MFEEIDKQQKKQEVNKEISKMLEVPDEKELTDGHHDAIAPPPPKIVENFSQRIGKLQEIGKKRGKRKKIYSIIGFVVIIIFVGGIAGVGYYFWDDITALAGSFIGEKQEIAQEKNTPETKKCDPDQKVCPDGSKVSRIPPDCMFQECPEINKEECAKEGEQIGAQSMPTSCCEGLKAVGGWPGGYEGDCSIPAPPGGLQICSNCGDGLCDINNGENKCNCVEDCGEGCTKEGDIYSIEPGIEGPGCCRGYLKAIFYPEDDLTCQNPLADVAVCINCGNKECGPGENKCNCPEDCEKKVEEKSEVDTSDWGAYRNEEFGFELKLPKEWNGYSVTTEVLKDAKNVEYGWRVKLRNPEWTEESIFMDIPIDIVTLDKWESIINNEFHPWAAPVNPGERGRNNIYVFFTEPRYNNNFYDKWEEVEEIIKTLEVFEIINDKEIITSDWETFVSEEIGFEITNTGDWQIQTQTDSQVVFVKNKCVLQVGGEERNYFPTEKIQKEIIEIDNKQFVKKTVFSADYFLEEVSIVTVSIIPDVISYGATLDHNCIDDINKILDTFKFTKDFIQKDIDSDGLVDDSEQEFGTDPENPDSDGDGYLDGEEVENGYNPMGEGKLN